MTLVIVDAHAEEIDVRCGGSGPTRRFLVRQRWVSSIVGRFSYQARCVRTGVMIRGAMR